MGAALVQAAPLFGIAVWVWQIYVHENDYNIYFVMFFGGVFMLGTGLLAALIGRFAVRSAFVRGQAAGSLRFHAFVAGVVLLVAALVVLGPLLDSHPWTIGNPPKNFEIAFALAALACGFIIPLVEAGRAVICGLAAWKA